ncbi:MAG: hypothetical protein K6D02_01905 [Lachnospiraceae bacterium]|nr:hypothetical protein [Lachnospiraceae bacterium]
MNNKVFSINDEYMSLEEFYGLVLGGRVSRKEIEFVMNDCDLMECFDVKEKETIRNCFKEKFGQTQELESDDLGL